MYKVLLVKGCILTQIIHQWNLTIVAYERAKDMERQSEKKQEKEVTPD